jgi:hypothetical protein
MNSESGVLAEEKHHAAGVVQVAFGDELRDLIEEVLTVLDRPGEALHQLDDVLQAEGVLPMRRDPGQEGLGQRKMASPGLGRWSARRPKG